MSKGPTHGFGDSFILIELEVDLTITRWKMRQNYKYKNYLHL